MKPNTADRKNLLTSPEARGNMQLANPPAHLDNEISAQPAVQVSRSITAANGCKVTLQGANLHGQSVSPPEWPEHYGLGKRSEELLQGEYHAIV